VSNAASHRPETLEKRPFIGHGFEVKISDNGCGIILVVLWFNYRLFLLQ
jgi:hypothetical protein